MDHSKNKLINFANIVKIFNCPKAQFNYKWEKIARSKQKLPKKNFIFWVIMAGRGFGKTIAGSAAVLDLLYNHGYRKIALIGATKKEVADIMINGESGILNLGVDAIYNQKNQTIKWKNGANAKIFNGNMYENLRGYEFDLIWIDEFCKIQEAENLWPQVQMTIRNKKNNPKIIITTTPRPMPLLSNIISNKKCILTSGTTFENKDNLSTEYLKMIRKKYKGTQFYDQEISGKIIEQSFYKITKNNIKYASSLPKFYKTVIAIDPAISTNINSDETGIIIAGSDLQKNIYVIEDLSTKNPPNIWMEMIIKKYIAHNIDTIVIEGNQGGNLYKTIIESINPKVRHKTIRAILNKEKRYEYVAWFYQNHKIFHKTEFFDLEKQLLNFCYDIKHDDRVDALFYAIHTIENSIKDSQFKIWNIESF